MRHPSTHNLSLRRFDPKYMTRVSSRDNLTWPLRAVAMMIFTQMKWYLSSKQGIISERKTPQTFSLSWDSPRYRDQFDLFLLCRTRHTHINTHHQPPSSTQLYSSLHNPLRPCIQHNLQDKSFCARYISKKGYGRPTKATLEKNKGE